MFGCGCRRFVCGYGEGGFGVVGGLRVKEIGTEIGSRRCCGVCLCTEFIGNTILRGTVYKLR